MFRGCLFLLCLMFSRSCFAPSLAELEEERAALDNQYKELLQLRLENIGTRGIRVRDMLTIDAEYFRQLEVLKNKISNLVYAIIDARLAAERQGVAARGGAQVLPPVPLARPAVEAAPQVPVAEVQECPICTGSPTTNDPFVMGFVCQDSRHAIHKSCYDRCRVPRQIDAGQIGEGRFIAFACPSCRKEPIAVPVILPPVAPQLVGHSPRRMEGGALYAPQQGAWRVGRVVDGLVAGLPAAVPRPASAAAGGRQWAAPGVPRRVNTPRRRPMGRFMEAADYAAWVDEQARLMAA